MSQPLTIKQAISQAKKALKQGNTGLAQELYTAVLQAEPHNPLAKKALRKLQGEQGAISPPQNQLNALLQLYQTGQLAELEMACRNLLEQFLYSHQCTIPFYLCKGLISEKICFR